MKTLLTIILLLLLPIGVMGHGDNHKSHAHLIKPTPPLRIKVDTIAVDTVGWGQKCVCVAHSWPDIKIDTLGCSMCETDDPIWRLDTIYGSGCTKDSIWNPILSYTTDTTYYLTPEQVEILELGKPLPIRICPEIMVPFVDTIITTDYTRGSGLDFSPNPKPHWWAKDTLVDTTYHQLTEHQIDWVKKLTKINNSLSSNGIYIHNDKDDMCLYHILGRCGSCK